MTTSPRDPAEPRGDDPDIKVGAFILTRADATVRWAGEARPGMPVLRWPSGALCIPAILWFCHSLATARVVASTLRREAYTLRLWLWWLWRSGVRWDEATDSHLRAWRSSRRGKVSTLQIERDCATVYRFYEDIPEAEVLGRDGGLPRHFVGHSRATPRASITTKVVRVVTGRGVEQRTGWRWAGGVARQKVKRPTPDGPDVQRLFEHLRGRALVSPSRRRNKSADLVARLSCDRSWLGARCMADAGLRADEVAGLTVSVLAKALAAEGAPGLGPASDPERPDMRARSRILDRLAKLRARGRRIIDVPVECKGSRRDCPFPIELLAELLSVGLWVGRERVLRTWRGRDPDLDSVFLSTKTGRALAPGSWSDVMLDGFRAIGVASSGHRLRAYFAENLARRLLEERMALNGGVLDDGVIKWVLRRVADALGHSSPRTTAQHYVDEAILKLGGRPPRR